MPFSAFGAAQVNMLDSILGLVDDVLLVLSRDGRILRMSRGARAVFGGAAGGVHEPVFHELFVACDRPVAREMCVEVDQSGSALSFRASASLRGEEPQPLIVHLSAPIEPGAARVLLARVTEASQPGAPSLGSSFRQLRELEAFFESAPIAFSQMDAQTRFVYVNRFGRRLLGWERDNIIGHTLRQVLGEAAYVRALPAIREVLAGRSSTVDHTYVQQNGNESHFLRHLHPHWDWAGNVIGYFSIMVDVTEARVTLQQQVRHEQRLREALVREINHRIKNTLQGIVGLVRLQASRDISGPELINQCVSQLMASAVAFGMASREGGTAVPLADLVRDLVYSVRQMSVRPIEVAVTDALHRLTPRIAEAHSMNISLVLNELIVNAVKHSTSGARVEVDVTPGGAVVSVRNAGAGLPDGFSLRQGAGLGTGLNLVKALLPLESCTLSIEADGQGVTARLELRQPVLTPERYAGD